MAGAKVTHSVEVTGWKAWCTAEVAKGGNKGKLRKLRTMPKLGKMSALALPSEIEAMANQDSGLRRSVKVKFWT
jgi:hypothetical protein